jgi:hypothetical protein
MAAHADHPSQPSAQGLPSTLDSQVHSIAQLSYGLLTYEHLIKRELESQSLLEEEGMHADRRLTMFGYNNDTFGMLIVPMLRDR